MAMVELTPQRTDTFLDFQDSPLNFKVDVEYNGSLPTALLNPYSWTKVKVLFTGDSPVGTGFSYATNNLAKQNKKWLMDHPNFLSSPVCIGGASYSGLTLPILVQDISYGILAKMDITIVLKYPCNFDTTKNTKMVQEIKKGFILGNPMTILGLETNLQIPYVHGMALISDELYETTGDVCSRYLDEHHQEFPDSEPPPTPDCRIYSYLLSWYWINNDDVQKAFYIRKGSIGQWKRCNFSLPYTRDIESSFQYHVNLSARGYRSLVYSGDHDMIVTFLATQAWIRALNYSLVDDWRPWMLHGQVAGSVLMIHTF
ncbi:hypothetical protein PTKIN_Ptkin09bG0149400 [Pterospermum kingtungense]